MGRKLALIIGNSQYDDAGLARLPAAQVDTRALADILKSAEVGQFDDITELADEGLATVRRAIARFFSQAKRDDLLVFYFSGHGIKDDQGNLYFAVRDTERSLLAGTSIESVFVTAQMDRSYSRRQVLILDCCHSGAFAHGTKSGGMEAVGTGPAFEGRGYGRVVLTATDSTQYAWEGDQIIGQSENSVFTHYLLKGLKTGEADRDGDGLITIDELYDYVYEHVVTETPKQTPGKWSYKQQGEIVLALNPHGRLAPAPADRPLATPVFERRADTIPIAVRGWTLPRWGLAAALLFAVAIAYAGYHFRNTSTPPPPREKPTEVGVQPPIESGSAKPSPVAPPSGETGRGRVDDVRLTLPATSPATGPSTSRDRRSPAATRAADTRPKPGAAQPPPAPEPAGEVKASEPKAAPAATVAPEPSRADLAATAEKAIREKRFQDARGAIGRLEKVDAADPELRKLLLGVSEGEVRAAVEAYAAAYSRRERDAVVALYPGVSQRELADLDNLRQNFRTYEMRITITKVDVDLINGRARVECSTFHNGITFAGKEWTNPKKEDLTFERKGGAWVRVR